MAVLVLTYEPEKLSTEMKDCIEYNIENWLDYLIKKEKDLKEAAALPEALELFEGEKKLLRDIVNHYKRNQQGAYERRKWLNKKFGIDWRKWHQPRPGLMGMI